MPAEPQPPILLVDTSVWSAAIRAGTLDHILDSGFRIETTQAVISELRRAQGLTAAQIAMVDTIENSNRVHVESSPGFDPEIYGRNAGEDSLAALQSQLRSLGETVRVAFDENKGMFGSDRINTAGLVRNLLNPPDGVNPIGNHSLVDIYNIQDALIKNNSFNSLQNAELDGGSLAKPDRGSFQDFMTPDEIGVTQYSRDLAGQTDSVVRETGDRPSGSGWKTPSEWRETASDAVKQWLDQSSQGREQARNILRNPSNYDADGGLNAAALEDLALASKALRVAGLAGLALDVIDTKQKMDLAYEVGLRTGNYSQLATEGGAFLGRMYGGVHLGTIGFEFGAAIGGPLGALLGGIAGGLAGALLGDQAFRVTQSVGNSISGALNWLNDALGGFLLGGGETKTPPRNPCLTTEGSDESLDGTYKGSNGTVYALRGTALTITSPDLPGQPLSLPNFRNGDYGIRLKEARPNMDQAECQRDPLIIDLDGDRNVVRELFDSSAYFDLDNDGFRERVAWSLAGDGFLVRDRNGNGLIDNGTELFGSGRTEFTAGTVRPAGTEGFAELALLDSNLDGAISAADTDFTALKVWVDANGDAITDEGEIKTLAELGIVSISLSTLASDDLDCGCDGTEVTYRSEVTFADGSLRGMFDAYLSIDQYDTREDVSGVEIPADFADLPFLIGSGTLSDLDVAMARDPALEEMVRAFAALDVSQASEITKRVEQIILRWTGADEVAVDSRGLSMNAQWLRAIERISGSDFNQARIGPNPRPDATEILVGEWHSLVQRVTGQLMGQTQLGRALMPDLQYAGAAFFTVDDGQTIAEVLENLVVNAPSDEGEKIKYWKASISALIQYAPAFELTEEQILSAINVFLSQDNLPLSAAELLDLEVVRGSDYLDSFGRRMDQVVELADADHVYLGGGSGHDVFVVPGDVQNVILSGTSGQDRLVLSGMNRADIAIEGVVSMSKPVEQIDSVDDIEVSFRIRNTVSNWQLNLNAAPASSSWEITGAADFIGTVDFADQKGVLFSDLLKNFEFSAPFGHVYFIAGAQIASQGTAGDDTIIGSEGDDTFIFTPGAGQDRFINLASAFSNNDILTIGANRADVTFRVAENGVDLVIDTPTGQAQVIRQFAANQQIEQFSFADGTALDAATLHHDLMTGTTGADTIDGTIASDVIDGHGGADLLRGGYGDDTYHFEIGYGGLRIADALGNNTIEMAGISSAQVVVTRTAEQTLLTVGNGANSIALAGAQANFQLTFSDRSVSLAQLLLEQNQAGNASNSTRIMGSIHSEYALNGTSGNDVIFGVGNYDYISGGTGDDTYIYAGAQWLSFYPDGGFDIVRPTAQFNWDNVILLERGIAFEGEEFGFINHSNTYVNTTGLPQYSDMAVEALVFADGRSVDFTSGWRNDGTAGSDILFNFSTSASTFNPGAGNDRIFSYGPIVTKTVVLTEGFGHDVWYHKSNFVLDMTAFALDARVSFERVNNDLVVHVDGDANSMTIVDAFHPYINASASTVRNASSVVQFAGGASLSLTDIAARISVASNGDDTLFGRADLDGGAGDDILIGNNVANIYHFGRGYGNDTIKEENQGTAEYTAVDTLVMHGLNLADITFVRHPDDPKSILITIKDTGETLVLDGTPWDGYRYIDSDLDLWTVENDRYGAHWIEQIQFADGTVISQREMAQQLLDAERTAGDDTIISFGEPTPASGKPGVYLDGGAGNDTYINDYYNCNVRFGAGYGNDVLKAGDASGLVDFTVQLVGLSIADVYVEFEIRDRVGYTVLKARDGSTLAIENSGNTWLRTLTVIDQAGVSHKVFQDGGILANLNGTSGNDYLVSSIGEVAAAATTRPNAVVDTFNGGAGDDLIQGYGGNDIVQFGRSDGTDTLLDSRMMGSSRNQAQRYIIQFDSDVTREDVSIGWLLDGTGRISVTINDTGDRLLLDPDNFSALVFADGRRVQTTSTGNGAEIVNLSSFLPASTAGDDTLLIRGGQTVSAGSGNDTIYYVGSTTELGTLEFGAGDGHDTFINRTSVDLTSDLYRVIDQPSNQLRLRGIYSFDELTFRRASDDKDDLIIEIKATGDTLRIVDQLFEGDQGYTDWAFRDIILANGAIYSSSAIYNRIVLDENTSGDGTITTGAAGGILDGGAGFDTLRGGAGDDSYIFGRAYDEDVIQDAGGSDTLYFEEGISKYDVVFSRTGTDGGDLLIEVLGTDRLSLTVANQFKLTSSQIESFRFSDGSVLHWDEIPALIVSDAVTSGDDVIEGFASADQLDGRAGNDRITGNGGNDTLIGGTGRDVAVYRGNAADYTITTVDGRTVVTDNISGRDGIDTLEGIEDLVFLGGGNAVQLVPENHVPSAGGFSVNASEDQVLTIARSSLAALTADVDGDALTFGTLANFEHGVAWFDLGGNIRFRPDLDYSGQAGFTYSVSDDNGGTATGHVTIAIAGVNDAPRITETLEAISVLEDQSIDALIPQSAFTDPDGDPVVLALTLADGTPLPEWLQFDGSRLTGTPPANFNGTVALLVGASDGITGMTTPLTLTISAVNDAPYVAVQPSDQAIVAGANFSFALPETIFTDIEGDELSFEILSGDGSSLPGWIVREGLTLSGTAPVDFEGPFSIAIVADDGRSAAYATFDLVTVSNHAPELQHPIGDLVIAEDSQIDFLLPNNTFSDADDDALTLSAKLEDGSSLPNWLHFDGSRFTGTPPLNFNGSLVLLVTASDGQVLTNGVLHLTVTAVNDAPMLSIALADQTVSAGGSIDWSVPAGSFTDVDGEQLAMTATLANGPALPAWLSFDGQRFTGTAPEGYAGNLDIRVSASDGLLAASDTFSLAVLLSNQSPNADDDGLFVTDQAQQLVIAASDLLGNDSDPDGDPLQIVSVQGAAHGIVSIAENGDIVYSADGSYIGDDSFTYTLSDGTLVDTATVSVRVDSPFATWSQGTSGNDKLFGNMAAANQIFGAGGNDQIKGGQQDDWLAGGDGDDHLIGLSGDDHFWGGAGNDVLNGNAGLDVAHYFGLRSSYSVVTANGSVTVVDNAPTVDGDDGTDTISSIEQLVFKNGETASVSSPIILDLDGKGVKTLTASQSRATFDLDGDGRRDDTSWIGNTEGFLFLDRDGNNTLSNARELSFIDDLPGAKSDLDGLRAFDSNGDGRLSAEDAQFASFRVWRDKNGNGNVDRNEVLGLVDAGVKSINLTGTAVNAATAFGEVAVVNRGSYDRTDGTTMEFVDAALTYFSAPSRRNVNPRLAGQMAMFGENGADIAAGVSLNSKLDAAIAALSCLDNANPISAVASLSDAEAFLRYSSQQPTESKQGQSEGTSQRTQALPTVDVPVNLATFGEVGVGPLNARYGVDMTESSRMLALLRQDMAGFGPSSAIDRMEWKPGAGMGTESFAYF